MASFDKTGFPIFLTQDYSFIIIIHCLVMERFQRYELKVVYIHLYLEPMLTLTEQIHLIIITARP